jgi:hypothetical protein
MLKFCRNNLPDRFEVPPDADQRIRKPQSHYLMPLSRALRAPGGLRSQYAEDRLQTATVTILVNASLQEWVYFLKKSSMTSEPQRKRIHERYQE